MTQQNTCLLSKVKNKLPHSNNLKISEQPIIRLLNWIALVCTSPYYVISY